MKMLEVILFFAKICMFRFGCQIVRLSCHEILNSLVYFSYKSMEISLLTTTPELPRPNHFSRNIWKVTAGSVSWELRK